MASQSLADLSIGEVTAVVQRANQVSHGVRLAPKIDQAKLRTDVDDLLSAVGIANDGSEGALLFAALSATDLTHKELAKQCRAIAEAEDPLDRRICYGTVLAELIDKLRSKWTSRRHRRRLNRPHVLLGVTSDFLTDTERADIKEAALELKAYHLAQIRRERPTKCDQDTLLDGLADIFLSHTGSSQHRYELPHSVSLPFYPFLSCGAAAFLPADGAQPQSPLEPMEETEGAA
ncbi:MAG TPA: hypothetical protein VFO36_09765 [Nitrospiraceae bacterium]|nr:hypothetical protein [Nitrospiraceae bacterium]